MSAVVVPDDGERQSARTTHAFLGGCDLEFLLEMLENLQDPSVLGSNSIGDPCVHLLRRGFHLPSLEEEGVYETSGNGPQKTLAWLRRGPCHKEVLDSISPPLHHGFAIGLFTTSELFRAPRGPIYREFGLGNLWKKADLRRRSWTPVTADVVRPGTTFMTCERGPSCHLSQGPPALMIPRQPC